MKSIRWLFFALVFCGFSAHAAPVVTMTFDMAFVGYSRINSQPTLFTDPNSPIHDQVVISLPFVTRDVQIYDDSYASNYILNLGNGEPSAGVQISSSKIGDLFANGQVASLVQNGLSELGVTGVALSSVIPSPRDYAFIDKRDGHTQPVEQRFNTFFDANIMTSNDLVGMSNAVLTSMTRLVGFNYSAVGNVDPFSIGDVPQLIRDIDNSGMFQVLYTRTVDTYDFNATGFWTGRPFEVTYEGRGRLIGFTIDGVNMLVSEVPEPTTLALLGIGLVGFAVARRRKSV